MARRSDHTREEQTIMAVEAGKNIIAAEGFNKFSARKVARAIGYTIGTIYNIFESHDHLILSINAATLDEMSLELNSKINSSDNSIQIIKDLGDAYIDFADSNYNRWSALYEHTLPKKTVYPDWYQEKIDGILGAVEKVLLPSFGEDKKKAAETAQILWAGVHGICQLALTNRLKKLSKKEIHNLAHTFIDNFLKDITK